MSETCSICVESFTKQKQKTRAACPYCDILACRKCTQTYLLSTTEDPHCMGCRKAWTREVMDSVLVPTWVNTDYKKHRENVLVDRERSRLPAAQLIIERKKLATERQPILDALYKELAVLAEARRKIEVNLNRELGIIVALRRGDDPWASQPAEQKPAEERRVFIMPCPATGCRGFLSQAYKCGVCDIYVCPDCREIKGKERDAQHTCNPDTIATVQKLKKECRPCPDCGTQIFKIEGCDQMFCTHCNTPFSWTSGKRITTGALHNPHYFEYIRKLGNGDMPRTPGDIPCLANLPAAFQIINLIKRHPWKSVMNNPLFDDLMNALRTIHHIQQIEIANATNRQEDTDNTAYNVQYLLGEMTEDKWKKNLQQREKRRLKRDEFRMRYEALVGAFIDIYGGFMQTISKPGTTLEQVEELIRESHVHVLNLVTLFNDSMIEIGKRYKCSVVTICPTLFKEQRVKPKVFLEKLKNAPTCARRPTQYPDTDDETESESEDERPGLHGGYPPVQNEVVPQSA